MAKAQLKLVHSAPEPAKNDVVLDDIFFHKTQLRIGTVLQYWGRSDSMSEWKIAKISSYYLTRTVGKYQVKAVDAVRHLSDTVEMVRVGGNERKSMTFSYMSYSAIWRLAP